MCSCTTSGAAPAAPATTAPIKPACEGSNVVDSTVPVSSKAITSAPVIAFTLRMISGLKTNPAKPTTSAVLRTCDRRRDSNSRDTTDSASSADADVATTATTANGMTMR
jgi:hypothetical protein